MSRGRHGSTQVAESLPFDNTNNDFQSDNVQEVIEEIGASASPGYSFGRSGALNDNTWLRRPGGVSSNRAGVTINIDNPVITNISCANRNIDTYTVEIYEHDGDSVNLTLLGSVTVISARSETFQVSYNATKGRQLAVRLGTAVGSVSDLGVDITLIGSK